MSQNFASRYQFENYARFPGQRSSSSRIWENISRRVSPLTQKIITFTPTAQNTATYTVQIGERTVSVISDASGTATEIVTLLTAAIRADARMYGQVTLSGTTTLIVTVREPGDNLPILAGTANLTAATTQAAGVAATASFGTFAMASATVGYCQTPSSSVALPKIVTVTPTAVNSERFALTIIRNDTGASEHLVIAADASATAQEIATALVAELGLSGFTGDDTGAVAIFTGPDGVDFDVIVTEGGMVAAVTQASSAAAFTRDILGVLVRDATVGQATQGSSLDVVTAASGYPAGRNAEIAELGPIGVLVDSDMLGVIVNGDSVYIRTTADGTGELGYARNDADGGNAVLKSGVKFSSIVELVGDQYVAEVKITGL